MRIAYTLLADCGSTNDVGFHHRRQGLVLIRLQPRERDIRDPRGGIKVIAGVGEGERHARGLNVVGDRLIQRVREIERSLPAPLTTPRATDHISSSLASSSPRSA